MSYANSPYRVTSSPFEKSLQVPTSKSHANRLLILAALNPQSVTITSLSTSSDTQTLLQCLKKMGLKIEQNGADATIANSFPDCEPDHPVTLETGDGGTTNRFLAALAARGKQRYRFHPGGPMKSRPLRELTETLERLGVHISRGNDNSFELTGPCRLDSREISIDCSRSTQFASALMLALANTATTIHPTGQNASGAYLAMTRQLIQESSTRHEVPPDFSSLGYPLALGMTCGQVVVENCHRTDPYQADSVLISIAQKMGAHLHWDPSGLMIRSAPSFSPLDQDGSHCPDLIPTLAFLASYAHGTSRLRELGILRHKESDRIEETLRLLKTFGVSHSFDSQKDELTITGPSPTAPFLNYDPPDDHRMVMTAYLFMRKNSGGMLSNTRHVAKSFPNFLEVME